MNRKKFLSLLSLGTAASVLPLCALSCTVKNPDNPTQGNTGKTETDLELSLNDSKYSKLKTKGNYVRIDDIVVVYGTDGNYYAVQAVCPHEKGNIMHIASDGKFMCDKHPNYFSNEGVSEGQYTAINLKTYTVKLANEILSIKR